MAAAETATRRSSSAASAAKTTKATAAGEAEEKPKRKTTAAAKKPAAAKAAGAKTPRKTAAKADPAAKGATKKADGDEPEEMEGAPGADDLTDDVELVDEPLVDEPEEAEDPKNEGDFVWDEEESEALRQARKDAELTASADSVRAYLKQIGKVALLNAEEEVELAKRIEAGLYAAERVRRAEEEQEKLTPQLRRDLRWIVRDGERAKNHLLEANLRLVVSLAKRYTGRGMAFLDLIQEGNLGLIRAVENL